VVEDLIKAYREHRPDLIGLSGLLVKSAQQMGVTAEDLRAAAVRCPVPVGGAALSAKFTAAKIAPAYASLVCYERRRGRAAAPAGRARSHRGRRARATARIPTNRPLAIGIRRAVAQPTPPHPPPHPLAASRRSNASRSPGAITK